MFTFSTTGNKSNTVFKTSALFDLLNDKIETNKKKLYGVFFSLFLL